MDRLVAIAVSRRYLMVGLFAAVIVGGLIAFKQLNIEAYPDPTPPMVDIVTQSPGLSSEEIERYITIPIETQVSHQEPAHDSDHLAVRTIRRQTAVFVRLHL
jgi:cobalt-zinc-cadmium resistance protein CzcA